MNVWKKRKNLFHDPTIRLKILISYHFIAKKMTFYIAKNKTKIAYQRYGSGKKVMLAFHGFGQSKAYYRCFDEHIGKEFSIYAFDLLFHGESWWGKKETPIEPGDWRELLDLFFTKENIDCFVICGYSLGGKYALVTLQLFPHRVEKMMMIAPDGIKTSFWYSLATYPDWMRAYFKYLVFKPQSFHRFLLTFNKLKLVDKSLLKFAHGQMNTRKKRYKVYFSWVVTRHLIFDMKEIAQIINNHNIPLHFYLGRYDRIITLANMSVLLKYLNEKNVHILETGHNNLIEHTARYLKKHEN